MLKNSRSILAAAVLGALPVASHAAVTFTLSLDTSVMKYGTIGTTFTNPLPAGTSVAVAGTNGAYFNTVTQTAFLPAGDGLTYGYDGQMSGADNGTSVGIGAFAVFLNNSSPSVAVPAGGTTKAAPVFTGSNPYAYNSAFLPANTNNIFGPQTPMSSGAGSVGVLVPVKGYIGTTDSNPGGLPAGYTAVGGSAPALLVSNLEFDLATSTPASTTVITPSTVGSGIGSYDYYMTGASGGYGDQPLTAGTDTVNYTNAILTISVAAGSSSSSSSSSTTSSSSSSHHPIVVLGSGALGSNYGSQIGHAITITGGSNSYTVGYTGTTLTDVGGVGYTTGFTSISTFSPVTDTEVYALKLNSSGVAISPTNTTLINAIVSDLNTAGNFSNVSAGAVAGSIYASLFPGYDVLLTSTGFSAGTGGVADLGIDFSQDTDPNTPGLVVTEVAAVPEPATAAGVVLGAAGLLLGRRKKQLASA